MIFTIWCVFGVLNLMITIYLSMVFSKYKPAPNSDKPPLSVIIAAHNEEGNLKKLIPVIQSQKYPDFEIIVALDRTSDNSKSYLDTCKKVKSVVIKDVPPEWNPKKYALNEAIKKASGEWLVFTDADCVPASDDWLNALARVVDNKTDIVLGVSPYEIKKSFLSRYIHFESFMTAFVYIGRALQGRPYMGVGRNMMINTSFFSRVGGYESIYGILGGDDDLFIQQNAGKSNVKVALGPQSLVWTYPKASWQSYFKQKLRHLSVGSLYKSRDQLFLSSWHLTHLGFFLLIFLNTSQVFFWPMLLFYLFIKLVSYRFAASKIGMHINYMLLPLVDMLYAVLTPVIALWSKLVKDIPWKN